VTPAVRHKAAGHQVSVNGKKISPWRGVAMFSLIAVVAQAFGHFRGRRRTGGSKPPAARIMR
jgi:hypothetical protein